MGISWALTACILQTFACGGPGETIGTPPGPVFDAAVDAADAADELAVDAGGPDAASPTDDAGLPPFCVTEAGSYSCGAGTWGWWPNGDDAGAADAALPCYSASACAPGVACVYFPTGERGVCAW